METVGAIVISGVALYIMFGTHWSYLLDDISALYNDISAINFIGGFLLWLTIGASIIGALTPLTQPREDFNPKSKYFIVCVLICLITAGVAIFYPADKHQEEANTAEHSQREEYLDERAQEELDADEQYKEDDPIGYGLNQNPDAISWEDASEHIGDYVTICGIIEDVDSTSADGNPTFVDMGDTYPNDRVTGVIWNEYQSEFPNISDYAGYPVYMSGTLYEYNGIPNIELTDSSQIQEVE